MADCEAKGIRLLNKGWWHFSGVGDGYGEMSQFLQHILEPKIGAHGKPVVFLHPADCNGVLTELEEA